VINTTTIDGITYIITLEPYSRRCWKCGETKPLSDFHRSRTSKHGHKYLCKECNKLAQKTYYHNKRKRGLPHNPWYACVDKNKTLADILANPTENTLHV